MRHDLQPNLPKPQTLVCALENRSFSLEYSTYRVIHRAEFCECLVPYYLALTMLSYENNAATMDGLFNMYDVFNKILFDHLKANHQIIPGSDMEKALMFLTSDMPSYNLPDLNVKIPDKLLSRRILDEDTGLIYGKLQHTLTYMLQNHDTQFYKKEDKF